MSIVILLVCCSMSTINAAFLMISQKFEEVRSREIGAKIVGRFDS